MALTLNGSNNTIAGLAVGGLPDGTVDTDMLAAGAATQAKRTYAAGEIIQAKSYTMPDWDSATIAANAWWDLAASGPYEVDITPTSTSSKILVFGHVYLSCSTDNTSAFVKIMRDSTMVGSGTASSSRRQINGHVFLSGDYHRVPLAFNCIDSPSSTSSLKYAANIGHSSTSSRTFYMNRTIDTDDSYSNPRTASSITVMELAQ